MKIKFEGGWDGREKNRDEDVLFIVGAAKLYTGGWD
jgi:hypothetical protein